jgi:hypothetical protein
MKLAEVDDVIQNGIVPALDHSAVPLWADGQNVVFQENSVRPLPAQISVASKISTEVPRGAFEVRLAGVRMVFWGTQTKLFKLVEGSGTPVDVTRTAGAYTGVRDSTTTVDAHCWTFVQWGDNAVVATNGIDEMQYFEAGNSNFSNFTDSPLSATGHPTFAKCVSQVNAMCLALGTSNGLTVVDWCSQDALATWTPAADNTAGSITLHGMNSEIMATVAPFQGGVAVLGSDDLFLLSWIGAPYYIGQQKLLSGVGALGPLSVTIANGMIYGICPDGIYRTDGVSVEWLDKPVVYDYLFSQSPESSGRLNRAQSAKVLTWHDPSQTMVNFYYPAESDKEVSKGVGFNYSNNSWTLFSFGRTSATSGSVFFNPFVFSNDGGIYQQMVGDIAPSVGDSPLSLAADMVLTLRYNEYGYGNGGFGGVTNGNG